MAVALAGLGWLAACASPEASRVRGGDPGAYFADGDGEVTIDGKIDMYHQVSCTMVIGCEEATPNSARPPSTDSPN